VIQLRHEGVSMIQLDPQRSAAFFQDFLDAVIGNLRQLLIEGGDFAFQTAIHFGARLALGFQRPRALHYRIAFVHQPIDFGLQQSQS
jgi:hypothetical protein